MKKLISGITVVLLLMFGAITYAHGPGGGCCGQMMGQGYGAHMMGPGYGGHMMRQGGTGYGYDQKFLDETVEKRRELHNKRFEYFEALRNPETPSETITKLEKEIQELQEAIYKKASRLAYGKFGGHRCRW